MAQIVESVFVTMMNLEVCPSRDNLAPAGDQLTSAVQLTGEWNGAVLLECNRRQACHFAGRFLSMDPPEAVDDDVRDVLGELANMIGGNMKCSWRRACAFDALGHGWQRLRLRVCGSQVQDRLAFECGEGPFWVTLLAVAPEKSMGNRDCGPDICLSMA